MKNLSIVGIIIFLTHTTATGQSTTSHLWSLKECIEYAKANNIQINTAQLNRKISSENYLQAQAAIWPDLYGSGTESANHVTKNATNGNTTINTAFGFSSSLTLYNGGYLRSDIRQKELLTESANLSILENINDITIKVTQAFLTILMDKETIVYATDLAASSKAELQQATQRFTTGGISKKDFMQSQAQLAHDQLILTQAVNAERRDKLTLKQLLQLTDPSFDISRPDTLINAALTVPLSQTQAIAMQSRPEIKNAELNEQIAELDLKKARAGYKPTLALHGGIGTNYLSQPNYSEIKQFDNNFYQQVGLTLSLPIFTKRVAKSNVEIAKIGMEQSQLDLKNTQTTLLLSIEQAYINVQDAQGQYDAAIEQLNASREVYRITGEEWRIGSLNMVDYILQRNQYIQALQNYLQAKYNAALSVQIYDFYRGVPITGK
jgi:outer membrane protein